MAGTSPRGTGPVIGAPVTRVLLAALVTLGVLVVGMVELGAVSYAYDRMGIGPGWMAAVLVASLLGSFVDVPVAVIPARLVRVEVPVRVYGVLVRVPALLHEHGTVVAVNVGGAVVPVGVAAYLVVAGDLRIGALPATLLVTGVVFAVARPVPGVGVVTPALVPPAAAAVSGLLLGAPHAAATAFVAGTLGTLVGADLLTLPRVRELGAPRVSIGGAGTFDGIFLAGLLGVLLASL